MSPLMTAMASTKTKRHCFVGQVIDHISNKSLTVWVPRENGAFRAVNVLAAEFPVGSIVDCTMTGDDSFIEELHLADERTKAEYHDKLTSPNKPPSP